MNPELKEALIALRDFRQHVLKYAKVWDMAGGTHHHPMWLRVADILEQHGMND